ncbi:MAG: DUF1648 domain-containing protein [Clostridium sp.]|nr:DUF1648 domain-containing protein [Clostridium sp.]
MISKKTRLVCALLACAGLLVTAVSYPLLPDQIPTNWQVDGTVAYSPKSQIWLIYGLLPLFTVLFDVLPRIDPRKNHYRKFAPYYDSFCIFLEIFCLIILGIILSESFYPGRLSVGRIVISLLGILFMWIGNMMPKLKSNYYMGIKTPWTLSDDDIWLRTHRLGGKTMFLAGAMLLIFGRLLATKGGMPIALTGILLAAFLPALMSYVWWRQKQSGTDGR